MQLLFDNYVLPPLLQVAAGGEAVCQRTLRFFGLHETELENLLQGLCQLHEGLSVGYYPNFPENHLTLTVRGPKSQELEATLDDLTKDLAAQAGDAYLGAATLEENVGQLVADPASNPGRSRILQWWSDLPSAYQCSGQFGLFPGRRGDLQQSG